MAVSNYGQYCKPNLHAQLQALSLAIPYSKGKGNYLYYDKNGVEIKVLDFLGGFGSLLFGHNNEALVEVIKNNLNANVPFGTQGSDRVEAGALAEALNKILKAKFNRDYLTILSNSGTEAVEISVKHAFYHHYHNKVNLIKKIDSQLKKIEFKNHSNVTIDPSVIESLPSTFCCNANRSVSEVVAFVKKYNETVFKQAPILLALRKGYHGKTTSAIQLTFNSDYKKELLGVGPTVIHLPANQIDPLKQVAQEQNTFFYTIRIKDEVLTLGKLSFSAIAAFAIEPIQGEGGMNLISKSYVAQVQQIAKSYYFPIIFDEIQCGMGRTGTFLYAEQLEARPDYIILSKSLGGGLSKIAATLIPKDIFGDDFDIIHSSTFAEDSMSSSIALKSLSLLDQAFFENIQKRSAQLQKGISIISDTYPNILKEVRGAGLMLGLEFESQALSGSNCLRLLQAQDLLGFAFCGYLLHEFNIRTLPCLSNKMVLRIQPSGYITEAECNYFLSAIKRLCEVIAKQNMFELCKFVLGKEPTNFHSTIQNFYKPNFIQHKQLNIPKVAFIGHFIEATDMSDWDDSFALFSAEALELFLEKIAPIIAPFLSESIVVQSNTGACVQIDMMGFTTTSKLIVAKLKEKKLESIQEKINTCVQSAKDHGYNMVGFGGFSSIVTGNCKNVPVEGIGLTSGNAFTVAMGLEAMLLEARRMNIQLGNATFAAIGAAGNIASVYSELMAEQVQKIILIGTANRLERVHQLALKIFSNALQALQIGNVQGIGCLLSKSLLLKSDFADLETCFEAVQKELGDEFPIIVSDEHRLLRTADLILGATNAASPVIYPALLGKHPIVICDIALPFDVDDAIHLMPNVKVIQGGIVALPHNPTFKIGGIRLPHGMAYACMSETILLGLERETTNYSYGNISVEQVKKIHKIGKLHGFKIGQAKLERSF